MNPDALASRLRQALPAAPEAGLAALAAGLHAAWSEPQRAYHTLQHLQECLEAFDAVAALADDPAALTLALLFHDAIYDPKAHDNEARSADWAGRALPPLGVPPKSVEKVRQMVLATQSHQAGGDADTALLLDIDLAILGAAPARFAEYEAQIRREYGFVSEPDYQAARARVMRGFAQRPRLYQTDLFHARLAAAAMRNLSAWA